MDEGESQLEDIINLQQLFKILWKRLFLIISFAIVAAGITASISYFVLPPIYQAQTQILVNQKNNDKEAYVLAQQQETDLQLINTYNVIIKSPAILNKVIEKLKLDVTPEMLTTQISVSSESNSKVVNIKVEDSEPQQAVEISNTVAEVFKEEIPKLMSVDNINILSVAKMEENPSPVKPNKILNTCIAAVVGLLIGIGLAFLLEILNTTIKNERDIEEVIELPIMGLVSSIAQENDIKSQLQSRRNRRK